MGRKIQYYDHMAPKLGDVSGLTERRAQVLELVACGLTTEDIALKLGISEDTVKAHLDNLRRQFAALNRVELIYQACAHGVLKCDAATFSRLRELSSLNLLKPSPIEKYARWSPTRTRQSVGVSLGQKAVAPVFKEASAGEADYFDIPTVFRDRLHRSIADLEARDQQRLIAYTHQASERLASMDKQEVAA